MGIEDDINTLLIIIRDMDTRLNELAYEVHLIIEEDKPKDRSSKEKAIKDTIQEEVDKELKDLGLTP